MGGKRRVCLDALSAAALAVVLLSPASGVAGTRCKAGAVSGAGIATQNIAVSNWSQKARRAYGAAWANFGLARAKSFSQTALPATTMYFVTAIPCRRT